MAMTTRYSAAATQRQRWSALKNLRMARTSKTRATAPTGSPMAGPIKGSAHPGRQYREDNVAQEAARSRQEDRGTEDIVDVFSRRRLPDPQYLSSETVGRTSLAPVGPDQAG